MPSISFCSDGSDLLAHVADRAVGAAPLPDLGAVLVVVPALGMAAGLRQAIAAAADALGFATVVPPRVATLEALIDEAVLAHPVVPRARRLADLQRLLATRGWFGGAPRWEVCRAILGLADELSARLPEPPDENGFMRLIEAHYRGRGARVALPEARLVYEVWRAYARPVKGASLDPGLARRMLLAAAARAQCGPVVWVASRPGAVLAAEEAAFVELLAPNLNVTIVAPRALPEALELAWPARPDEALAARAARLTDAGRALLARVRIIQAPTLEAEARAAAGQVRNWLNQGKRAIALVAADRVVARRVRALLEREGVLLADEAGWKLSTTSAATCVMRWIDAVSGGFHQRDLQDWLRSPFVFADLGRGRRERARAAIEAAIRSNNVQAGLGAVRHALLRADHSEADALVLIDRIETAARPWARRAASLDQWFDLLLETLAALGAAEALAADAAGALVQDLARSLREQLGGAALQPLAVWRELFASELEAASFRDGAIDSPVVMTSLARARLRSFEGVLLLGAGAAHLGSEREPGPLLASRLRAELGLATPEETGAELRDTLGMLIACADDFCATWQSGQADMPQPLSPYLARLDGLARAGGGASLIVAAPAARLDFGQAIAPRVPAPGAPDLRPAAISVSAHASLVACPYQFFARHMLGLNEADEIREEFEKSDYGIWVHDLLNRLHTRFPLFTGMAHDVLVTEFQRIADAVFAPAIEFNFLSLGWKERWVAVAAAYIEWQIERERGGWRWQAGEVAAEASFMPASGNEVRLRGRLDRLDIGRGGAVEILDYKTQAIGALRNKVALAGEDVQLAAYRLLHPAAGLAQAAFVAVDGDRIGIVPANPDHTPERERRRLVELIGAIDAGAGLPANGIDGTCEWCEMQGLCRRGHWATTESDFG